MDIYDRVRGLPLTIESYSLKPLTAKIAGVGNLDTRKTVVFELHGKGKTGVGEDVTYFEDLLKSLVERGPVLPLPGTYSFGEFSEHLQTLDWFPDAPEGLFHDSFRNYRRWAIESAALDLALQQSNTNLAEVLGKKVQPLTFVASMRLGEPSSFEPVKKRLERYPQMRFKLDPFQDWTDELIAQLADSGAVATMDFKGFYKGTEIETKTDPVLYQKIVDAFPEALLEDPDVTEETRPILEPQADRVTWDFPIHDVASINAQAFKPKTVNIKPSRFGAIKELFAAYDYCQSNGLGMYSGGQTEIGPGRGQVQYLSALFHPDAPNDIAPAVYNSADASVELPQSPIVLKPKPTGFGLDAE
jgi:hypothetical protein